VTWTALEDHGAGGGTDHLGQESATAYYIRPDHLCHAPVWAEAAARQQGQPLVHISEDVAKVSSRA
jgi:hypothetical protein